MNMHFRQSFLWPEPNNMHKQEKHCRDAQQNGYRPHHPSRPSQSAQQYASLCLALSQSLPPCEGHQQQLTIWELFARSKEYGWLKF